jgi:excinuclease ABC subunit A
MCEDTGISYEEPSPNSFSFNSPYGACPTCKGLGTVYTVDMKAIIPDENLSINDGGIAPLGGEREAYIFRQVQTLSKKHKFSLDKPIKDLPKKTMNFLLYGNEEATEKELQFDEEAINGNIYETEFEGIINQVKRWFATTTSEAIQRWAESFMELTTCNTCKGSRLKKESLWFKVDEKNISELSGLDLVELLKWFDNIEEIFIGCRPYLSFVKPAYPNAKWWRIATHPVGYTNRFTATGHNLYFRRALYWFAST